MGRRANESDDVRDDTEGDMDFEDDFEVAESLREDLEDESRTNRRPVGKRRTEAGRLIEQVREERELQKALADFDDYVV